MKGPALVGQCLPEVPVKREALETVQAAVLELVPALDLAMTPAQEALAEEPVLEGPEPARQRPGLAASGRAVATEACKYPMLSQV